MAIADSSSAGSARWLFLPRVLYCFWDGERSQQQSTKVSSICGGGGSCSPQGRFWGVAKKPRTRRVRCDWRTTILVDGSKRPCATGSHAVMSCRGRWDVGDGVRGKRQRKEVARVRQGRVPAALLAQRPSTHSPARHHEDATGVFSSNAIGLEESILEHLGSTIRPCPPKPPPNFACTSSSLVGPICTN